LISLQLFGEMWEGFWTSYYYLEKSENDLSSVQLLRELGERLWAPYKYLEKSENVFEFSVTIWRIRRTIELHTTVWRIGRKILSFILLFRKIWESFSARYNYLQICEQHVYHHATTWTKSINILSFKKIWGICFWAPYNILLFWTATEFT
jgi:hypothetical protein